MNGDPAGGADAAGASPKPPAFTRSITSGSRAGVHGPLTSLFPDTDTNRLA